MVNIFRDDVVMSDIVLAQSMPDTRDFTDRYNTELSPEQEAEYQKTHDPQDSYDYDMRGAFKNGVGAAGNGHYPDTYKKPNHPTFSNESQYSGVDGYSGGSWSGSDGSWAYTPSQTNVQMHGIIGLQNYFDKREPGVTLKNARP